QQRQLAPRSVEHGRREILDRPVAAKEPRRLDLPVAGQPRVAVRGVADQREPVGAQRGLDPELLTYRVSVADLLAAPIDLHDTIALHALREVLVGRPYADLPHARVPRRVARGAGERVVRL